ncbi:MAG: DNA alkylation repair protein [Prochloraceae cyanobacterium]|nr:DNA alkylation repair protein [Prochloraceae cyanobacterium]
MAATICSTTNSLFTKISQRRIAIISTFHFIKNNQFEETINISTQLIDEQSDLIHKAVGWMLREVDKRDLESERNFLKVHYKNMPRTMLRYAIERFPKQERK